MANFVNSSVNVGIQLVSTSLSTTYAGTPGTGIFIWGAQVEFNEFYNVARNNLDLYNYVRSNTGASSNHIGITFMNDGRYDYITIGDPTTGLRTGNNSSESTAAFLLTPVKRGLGTYNETKLNINNNERYYWAPQTIELYAGVRQSTTSTSAIGRRWFQLAPYYNSYVHLLDQPTDYDKVRIGSQTGGYKTGPNPNETIAFTQLLGPSKANDSVTMGDSLLGPTGFGKNIFVNIAETKTIPRQRKYDAAQVMELFNYRESSVLVQAPYVVTQGSNVYYRQTEWYSMVPRFGVPQFALGTNNNVGPIMTEKYPIAYSDTSLLITQIVSFNFQMQDAFNTTMPPIGDPTYGYRKYSGNTNENINFYDIRSAKRGFYNDVYTKKYNHTTANTVWTSDIGWSVSSLGVTAYSSTRWFQLAPLYNTYYNHTLYNPNDTDLVIQSDTSNNTIAQDYNNPLLTIPEDFMTMPNETQDYITFPN